MKLLCFNHLPCVISGRLLAQTTVKLVFPLLPLSHVLGTNDQKLIHLLLTGVGNLVGYSAEEGLMWHPWPIFPFATAMQCVGWCGCHPPLEMADALCLCVGA